ncbi:lantibiotic dehydratase [Streptomyces sp. NPDC006975]|uniref:lantibiotic dehydratase n=1 Tax=Streptomyces sp. NPDC006975 TaxID=3154310 RepID=UPI0034547DC8
MGETETLFRAGDVFLLRAPVAQGADGLPLPADGTPPDDPAACVALLAAAAGDPVLDEALAVASPALSALVHRVARRGRDGLKASRLRRAALAVLRYDIRMRTRPTPFGLFAGVTAGEFDVTAKAVRGPGHRTRTHVDQRWLAKVTHRLEGDPAVLDALTVQAHQALTVRGDRLLLTAPSAPDAGPDPDGEGRATVSVRHTPLVARAVYEARTPVPYPLLVERLAAAFPQAPADRLRHLLRELVRQEILITGLRPPLDGGDPLRHVLTVLAALPGGTGTEETRRTLATLRRLDEERAAYDALPLGAGRDRLRDLAATARSVAADDTPLHIDTRLDATLHLPHAVRAEIERATDVMVRLSRPKRGLFALRDYHRRFLDVYGADRLVPVLDLLDPSTGLGAPAGYGWPNSEAAPVPPDDPRTARRERAMARLAAAALRARRREVVLTDADLAELRHDDGEPADAQNSCEVTVQVVAASADALTDGDFLVFLSPSPGSHRAGSTFARFADQDPAWREPFAALHRDTPVHIEGALAADLAFRPRSGRAANLAHTLPATGRRISVGVPDAPGVEELRLADIAVGATLDRLTAVHVPTGREIVPVLGNMVSAPAQAPNAARLLWEIGLEGQRLWEPWNWGPLADAPSVPRIRYGRFVLAPAVWRLDELRGPARGAGGAEGAHDPAEGARDAAEGAHDTGKGAHDTGKGAQDTGGPHGTAWDRAVARWRERWDVPRHILAVTADQRLLLDLGHAWHRELLRDQMLRHPDLIAQEVPGEHEGLLDSPLAGHTAELVVPLTRRAAAPAHRPYAGHHAPRRTVHGLGGDWLHLKLHGSARTQDDLLRTHLRTLVDRAREHGADRWFFIRYTDDAGHHLRLRLHADRRALWGTVAPAVGDLLDDWQRRGLVRGHTVAQYDPEVERYGGEQALATAEEVFQYDSEAAVDLLRLAHETGTRRTGTPAPGPSELGPLDLDALAVVSCAALAHAFGPPAPGHPLLTEDCGDDAAAAWLSMTGSRRDLPDGYRARPAHWRRLVDPYGGWPALAADPLGARALAALRERDAAVRRLAAAVRAAGATPEGRVVGSLMHMVCNRLFGGATARELTVLGIARGAVQDHLNRRRHQS